MSAFQVALLFCAFKVALLFCQTFNYPSNDVTCTGTIDCIVTCRGYCKHIQGIFTNPTAKFILTCEDPANNDQGCGYDATVTISHDNSTYYGPASSDNMITILCYGYTGCGQMDMRFSVNGNINISCFDTYSCYAFNINYYPPLYKLTKYGTGTLIMNCFQDRSCFATTIIAPTSQSIQYHCNATSSCLQNDVFPSLLPFNNENRTEINNNSLIFNCINSGSCSAFTIRSIFGYEQINILAHEVQIDYEYHYGTYRWVENSAYSSSSSASSALHELNNNDISLLLSLEYISDSVYECEDNKDCVIFLWNINSLCTDPTNGCFESTFDTKNTCFYPFNIGSFNCSGYQYTINCPKNANCFFNFIDEFIGAYSIFNAKESDSLYINTFFYSQHISPKNVLQNSLINGPKHTFFTSLARNQWIYNNATFKMSNTDYVFINNLQSDQQIVNTVFYVENVTFFNLDCYATSAQLTCKGTDIFVETDNIDIIPYERINICCQESNSIYDFCQDIKLHLIDPITKTNKTYISYQPSFTWYFVDSLNSDNQYLLNPYGSTSCRSYPQNKVNNDTILECNYVNNPNWRNSSNHFQFESGLFLIDVCLSEFDGTVYTSQQYKCLNGMIYKQIWTSMISNTDCNTDLNHDQFIVNSFNYRCDFDQKKCNYILTRNYDVPSNCYNFDFDDVGETYYDKLTLNSSGNFYYTINECINNVYNDRFEVNKSYIEICDSQNGQWEIAKYSDLNCENSDLEWSFVLNNENYRKCDHEYDNYAIEMIYGCGINTSVNTQDVTTSIPGTTSSSTEKQTDKNIYVNTEKQTGNNGDIACRNIPTYAVFIMLAFNWM